MLKKLILPLLVMAFALVSSCKKNNDPDPVDVPQTVKLEATSTGEFDVTFGAQVPGGGYRFLEVTTSNKTYTYEYAKLNSGDLVTASLTGATSADINATLKVNGAVVTPTIDKKDDKGNSVKSWQVHIK